MTIFTCDLELNYRHTQLKWDKNKTNIYFFDIVHTHTTVKTHTRSSGQPFMLWRPGRSWGFGVLLKSTSVVVLRWRESAVHSPPTLFYIIYLKH